MRRPVLIILGIAGGLVAVVLVAVAIIVATVDVNAFAQPLAARIQAATGRPFTIGGPLSLDVSLEPTLSAENVTLGNAPWGRDPAMLTAKRIEAQVALLPLLKKRFEIVRVTIIEPAITLETDHSGRGNWVFAPAGGAPPPRSAQPGPESAVAAAPALGIGEVEIRNGRIRYVDGTTGNETPVIIESLTLRSRDPSAQINAEFHGSVAGIPLALKGNLGSRAQLEAQQWPYPVEITGDVAGRNATLKGQLTPGDKSTQLRDFALAYGGLNVQGQVSVDRSGARPRYVLDLRIARLVPEALMLPVAAASSPGALPKAPEPSRHLIPDQPLPLAALRGVDADGTLAIDELALPHGQALQQAKTVFALRNGALELKELSGATLGGTLKARGTLNAAATPAALDLHVDARDLELKPLLALVGVPRDITGGRTRIALDGKASGASLHDWAASMIGNASVLVGPAELKTATSSTTPTLDRINEAVNPFRAGRGATELRCAVVRLPLRDGVARVDRTIAAETAEVGVSASGTIDLRTETLDLSLRPQLRQGVPINVAGLANLVRVSGPFTAPQVSIDPVKSAEAVARIGAIVGTGGWSLLGETLLNAQANADSPCAIALGAKPGSPPPAATAQKGAPPIPADLGKAIGKLFGR